MKRYDLLADIRDRVRGCLGLQCSYKLVIARGLSSYECDLISFWLGDDAVEAFEDCTEPGCDITRQFPLYITLVRICAQPQGQPQFDFAQEEELARCFYNDLDLVECCFDAGPWNELRATHGIDSITRASTKIDQTSRGGAYSARITLNISLQQCCG